MTEPSLVNPLRSFLVLVGVALATVALYWAHKVLIPVALALLLAFLLTPLVNWLQRRGLGRAPAAIVAVLLAFVVLSIASLAILWQLQSLANDLPRYQGNIVHKVTLLRQVTEGTVLENLHGLFKGIDENLPATGAPAPPVQVQVQPSGLRQMQNILGPAIEVLAEAVLAVVLVIFMLIGREDLRNRVVRLVGASQLVTTTRALDDSARRISRYLLMQSIVNGCVGLGITVGLLIFGVPYALLWGFLAATLRFIPYLGTWSVCLLLTVFCVAASPGWFQPIAAFTYFAILEMVVSQAVEPLLFGHSTGVSPVALLISAVFWTWLWGPIGLLMSIPLTTCLVVLGKYVPHLEFLNVLLGTEQVLDVETRYYQRLLARDQDEATELVETFREEHPPETVYDRLLVPALCSARRDRERGDLSLEDEQFTYQVTRAILEDLVEPEEIPPAAGEATRAERSAVLVVGCPARDEADALALEMFRHLVEPSGCRVEVLSPHALTGEVLSRMREEQPAVICIAALAPGGLAQTLYLSKRLHRQFPNLKIAIGRWAPEELPPRVPERLRQAGANFVATTLLESRDQILPLIQVAAHTTPPQQPQPQQELAVASHS